MTESRLSYFDSKVVLSEEVFEITDFTQVSDWERFIASLEDILNEWTIDSIKDLKVSKITNLGEWKRESKILSFGCVQFVATYTIYNDTSLSSITFPSERKDTSPKCVQDMIDSKCDFHISMSCLTRWFGIKEFIVLNPLNKDHLITSIDKVQLLLSSAAIALTNTKCHIPIFVSFEQENQIYKGIFQSDKIRICFDTFRFNYGQPKYYYVSKLAQLFRSKLKLDQLEGPQIQVSLRYTYTLDEWPSDWFNLSENISENPLHKYLGPLSNKAFKVINLSVTWSSLAEEMINDTPQNCNLNPYKAPSWIVMASFNDIKYAVLNQNLQKLVSIAQNYNKYHPLVTNNFFVSQDILMDDISETTPITLIPFEKILGKNALNYESETNTIVDEIFKNRDENWDLPADDIFQNYKGFKSCPFNCFTWCLAINLFRTYIEDYDFLKIAYIWYKIILILEKNCLDSKSLPRITLSFCEIMWFVIKRINQQWE